MTGETRTITVPDIELIDLDGNPVRLSDYRGKRHVVLVLLRGLM
jgi:peroxiredoxin